MAYWMMKALSRIVCNCPSGVRRRLGNCIGWITWLLVPDRRKKMAVENILLSLQCGEAEAARIAKCSWTRFGRMIMEVMAFPKIKQNIAAYVTLEGKENLEKALSFGKGVVLATSHSGNWELLGAALALYGYPIVGVAQKQTNAEMDKLINEYRALTGMHITYKNGVREMIRLLGQGNIIGMLMDQDAGRDGLILDFFNRKASCPQGPAFLARLKDAPVVPVFITENADGTHRVLIKELLWTEQAGDKNEAIEQMTKKLTNLIEEHICRYPEQWFWLHDRWKYTRQNEGV